MSKTHENAGRLALMQGNQAYAERNFPVAEELLKNAVREYSQAGNSDVVTENLEKAYINLSASLVAQSKLDEAIGVLTEADDRGFRSTEFNKNFAVAYYNLGLQQKAGDLDAAILSFTRAKSYESEDAIILYNLGLALLRKGEYDRAKIEFTELLGKEFSQDEFPLELQINSYCKLIECQLLLDEDVNDVLELASKMFSKLDTEVQVRHQEEAVFIYNRLIAGYLAKNNDEGATEILTLIEDKINGIAKKIVLDLEQYALHLYNTGNQKVAITMLLTLAHVQNGIIDATFLETIKEDLASMSDKLARGVQSDEFTLKVLGDIEHCDYDAINDLFA